MKFKNKRRVEDENKNQKLLWSKRSKNWSNLPPGSEEVKKRDDRQSDKIKLEEMMGVREQKLKL